MPPTSHRVKVTPEVIKWAIDYSRREDYLRGKYPKLADWESGSVRPTWKQLRNFAKDARVAHGYLYGTTIPDMKVEVPDMRTVGDVMPDSPSPDLIDTLLDCQTRQDWFSGYAESSGLAELPFVSSFRITDSPGDAAETMRRILEFGIDQRNSITRHAYRKTLVDKIEAAGMLVMINGVVGNDTSRTLDITEFRGFALSDRLAPVIFVNANDSLGAQLFTLAHELAHIWLGESAISAPDGIADPSHESERWCNSTAAEFLVPIKELRQVLGERDPIESMDTLGRHFKVSDQVILRRLEVARAIDRRTFRREYGRAVYRARSAGATASVGGNFYANLLTRVSRRFAESLYIDTEYGGTLYTEALRLLGLKNLDTFDKLGSRMGFEY